MAQRRQPWNGTLRSPRHRHRNRSLTVAASDVSALSGKDLSGATIQIRTEPWSIESRSVTALDAATARMGLATPTTYPMEAGDGYVLQDKLWMLDAPGEFFHDVATGTLYVFPSTAHCRLISTRPWWRGAFVTSPSRFGTDPTCAWSESLPTWPVSTAWSSRTARQPHSTGSSRPSTATPASALNSVPIESLGARWYGTQPSAGTGLYGINAVNAPNVDVVSNVVTDTGMIGSAANSFAAIWGGDGALIDRQRDPRFRLHRHTLLWHRWHAGAAKHIS